MNKIFASLIKPHIFLSGILLFVLLSYQPPRVEATQLDKSLFEAALSASREGDFVEALLLWNNFLEGSPSNPIALSNRGNVRLVLGDTTGAIEDQTMAINILPEELDPHLNRGLAEEVLELWEEAKEDYKWVLDHDLNNSIALYNLGNVSGAEGNWSQAEVYFAKSLIADPAFLIARSSEALAKYQLGEFEKAELDLRKIIRKYPMFADARAALSALLWRQGLSGEAESNWAAAVGLDSRYMQAEWLRHIRRWPPQPTKDLMAFLALENP